MKLNHRLLITSGLLLAMSTVAMSTATYAWFTTSRQTKLTVGSTTIKQDSNLEMKIVSINKATEYEKPIIDDTIGSANTPDLKANDWGVHKPFTFAAKALQDVSGDGVTFFKPNISSDGVHFSTVNTSFTETPNVGTLWSYVTELNIGFRSDKAYEVYLGENTGFVEKSNTKPGTQITDTWNLSNTARLAFFDNGAKNSPTLISAFEGRTLTGILADPSSEDMYEFLKADKATDTTFEGTNYGQFAAGDTDAVYKQMAVTKTAIEPKVTMNEVNNIKVCTLAPSGQKYHDANNVEVDEYVGYITVRLWIEGCDNQCEGDVRNGKFDTILEFNSFMPYEVI